MKKLLTTFLVTLSLLVCCFSFAACGDTNSNFNGKDIEKQIAQLQTVQFSDMWEIDNIERVQNNYNALNEEQKDNITNYAILEEKAKLLPHMKQYAKMVVSSIKYFHKSLKDPSSLIIEEDSRSYISLNSSSGESANSGNVMITYNAKNSYGGYTGKTSTIIHWNDKNISLVNKDDFSYMAKATTMYKAARAQSARAACIIDTILSFLIKLTAFPLFRARFARRRPTACANRRGAIRKPSPPLPRRARSYA